MEVDLQEKIEEMMAEYEPPTTVDTPTSVQHNAESPLAVIFRDVDE